MIKLLVIGSGGFIGAVLRYLVGSALHRALHQPVFPYGTLCVNLLGCFGIGLLGALFDTRDVLSEELRLFLVAGLLGGFTTFSSFGMETLHLLKNQHPYAALLYVLVSVGAGLAAAGAGYALGR